MPDDLGVEVTPGRNACALDLPYFDLGKHSTGDSIIDFELEIGNQEGKQAQDAEEVQVVASPVPS